MRELKARPGETALAEDIDVKIAGEVPGHCSGRRPSGGRALVGRILEALSNALIPRGGKILLSVAETDAFRFMARYFRDLPPGTRRGLKALLVIFDFFPFLFIGRLHFPRCPRGQPPGEHHGPLRPPCGRDQSVSLTINQLFSAYFFLNHQARA